MPSRRREDALSEVIGFILILALIAVLASLYLTYVVPAQGREAEIRHMAGINDQFLGYKTSVDSLWINDQRNVPISRTFTLGTLTGLTQGAFVVPLFQPYPSSGTMVVNGRGESISIEVDTITIDFPGNVLPNLTSMISEPRYAYIQIKTTNISKIGGITISPDPDIGNWRVFVNITPRIVSVSPSTTTTITVPTTMPTQGQGSSLGDAINTINSLIGYVSGQGSMTTCSDFTLTVVKNNNATFINLPIAHCIQNNSNYTINLFDDAYGLKEDLIFPFSLKINNSPPNDHIIYYYPIVAGYSRKNLSINHEMGSLEYLSNNNYWIQQNYYYQAGGVFLQQPDGMVTKVIPLISITNQSGIPYVRIVDVSISGSGNIGGTSPIQVVTRLDSVTHNIIEGTTLAQGIPNARNVTVTVNAQDTASAQMWNSTFAAIRSSAGGGIQNWVSSTQTGNLATLSVKNPSPGSGYDIILDYTRVNLTVELQPVAI